MYGGKSPALFFHAFAFARWNPVSIVVAYAIEASAGAGWAFNLLLATTCPVVRSLRW
jgi:hypothetical protein